jgi:hypothetical protein
MFSCIPAHTNIDTPAGPRPIEHLEAGDSVVGFSGKPVRILQKHSYLEDPASVFLRIAFADGASVDLCEMHRVAGIRAREIRIGQSIAGRKVTRLDSRRGETHSFDLLTEDAGYQPGSAQNSMIEEMQEAAESGMRSVRPDRCWCCVIRRHWVTQAMRDCLAAARRAVFSLWFQLTRWHAAGGKSRQVRWLWLDSSFASDNQVGQRGDLHLPDAPDGLRPY